MQRLRFIILEKKNILATEKCKKLSEKYLWNMLKCLYKIVTFKF